MMKRDWISVMSEMLRSEVNVESSNIIVNVKAPLLDIERQKCTLATHRILQEHSCSRPYRQQQEGEHANLRSARMHNIK